MIVTPPSGICASAPSNAPRAQLRPRRDSPGTLRLASHVTSASAIPTSATIRLPNSMIACWLPWVGKGAVPQRGHFSQPSPDAVSRTNAPEVMTKNIATVAAAASCMNPRGETR